ncbi:hypothetical protein DACRYDRAFT_103501 [Dacryopinax primogenitus]|uniref:Pentacotripeptide-repeat region of PRORP domain-containing protein n=1 Tax=Dacryopinax primogenitus (strain DJM 731) TaxID=1858805 RepID=M5GC14_DACPD|nr:uncharacterized protein DACRYDRAFT_103501 [Dacryopinax primogenitus]EJU06554.1 hypothetical protein DACRYDRAFT_103501 [Dacryopinax primogenitus]
MRERWTSEKKDQWSKREKEWRPRGEEKEPRTNTEKRNRKPRGPAVSDFVSVESAPLDTNPVTLLEGEASTPESRTGTRVAPPMRPYELAQRVTKLCEQGKLDEAISYVKSAPTASQNAIVWNTLIMYAFNAYQINTGYTLFIDMKRRGFTPIPSTWTIMFQGLARRAAKSDGKFSEQFLGRVSSAYTQFIKVLGDLEDNRHFQVTDFNIPFNAYLDLLLELGRHQELYDVFRSMEDYAPLKADGFTYSTVLRCILKRPDVPWKGETGEVKEIRDAVLARKVWDQIRAPRNGTPVLVDSHLISAILRIMTASPRLTDQQYGLDLVEEYLGLIKPGTLSPSEGSKIARGKNGQPLALTSYSFHLALLLAASMRRFRYILHYIQQVQDSPWAPHILNTGHLNLAINAHAELAVAKGSTDVQEAFELIEWMYRMEALDPKAWRGILPNQDTYTAMFRACWKGNDYNSARKGFSRMSGYDDADFVTSSEPKPRSVVMGRSFLPDAHAMSCLVRSSLSKERNISHALEIVRHIGLPHFFPGSNVPSGDREHSTKGSRHTQRTQAFYRAKLAEAILSAIDRGGPDLPFEQKWLDHTAKVCERTKMDFDQNWKLGPALREWMGESIDRENSAELLGDQ